MAVTRSRSKQDRPISALNVVDNYKIITALDVNREDYEMKLYEIDEMLRSAMIIMDEMTNQETGEIDTGWAQFVDDVQLARDEKALAVAAIIREYKTEAEAIATERKRIAARERVAENRAEALKGYLTAFLHPGEKLKDSRVSIGWSSRERVEVASPDLIPDAFCKIERTPRLKDIGEAIKTGTMFDGVTVVKNNFIVIR
jgi:hypothetical protein